MDTFHIWAGCCAHVHTDIRRGRESLADAIRHSERGGPDGAPGFEWDVMLYLGDFMGKQGTPKAEDAREVHRQLRAMERHEREQVYCVAGNHDGSGPREETQWWFRKCIDPLGEHPATSGVDASRRPFPVRGTWERYSFEIGNVLVLMMSDRNDGGPPVGRADRGGYPAGAVSTETFDWWVEMVESHQDRIIISCHHHMLKDTTVASGLWEGIEGGYHGRFDDGAPPGASYLYFVGDKPDAQAFERYLEDHPGAVDLWLGGHTHATPGDTYGGKSHIEQKWGTTFINVAAMTRYHVMRTSCPLTRLLTFASGSDEVRIRCYLHDDTLAPVGWYEPEERVATLRHRFAAPAG